jgi:hypothetical protein
MVESTNPPQLEIEPVRFRNQRTKADIKISLTSNFSFIKGNSNWHKTFIGSQKSNASSEIV